ncbi:heme NO-binding domain-containing protein [Glaciecola sp. XM2]|jgi:hypothetical protein|uniref:heme NO-binding domain-containing protein n=1 Tax=Glaciecola sp. XM2 TaxID=1914931 RepID=UPI001BDF4B85|nr:heme NO-binding domain-containing protein [Glaciecola sp. XM2]MBT1449500.1 heme NO-binding domain-containing protein [Glaciecola sp. XM2]
MKGIVFTEFNEMVETRFSPEMLDEIITECDLTSGGAYTAVGTYDHGELIQMAQALSDKTNTPVEQLVFAFGEHLAVRFSVLFTSFFDATNNTFDFMKTLDNHIHVEVKKLYPDADLPSFSFDDSDASCLIMEYRSSRGLSDLAHGLMTGVIRHYQENITINVEHVVGKEHVRFHLLAQ